LIKQKQFSRTLKNINKKKKKKKKKNKKKNKKKKRNISINGFRFSSNAPQYKKFHKAQIM
jgi:hypothetical protein